MKPVPGYGQRRMLAVIMCAVLLLTMVSASACMVCCSHHTCSGMDCTVCDCVRRCGELMRVLACILTAVTAAVAATSAPAAMFAAVPRFAPVTLTAQGIRLND